MSRSKLLEPAAPFGPLARRVDCRFPERLPVLAWLKAGSGYEQPRRRPLPTPGRGYGRPYRPPTTEARLYRPEGGSLGWLSY